MKSNYLKQTAYSCLIAIALTSTISCSTNEEPMPESSNTELNTTGNDKNMPDITFHPVYSNFHGTYYVSMFNGSSYTTPSKPRRVIVTYDDYWNKITLKTVNKTYTAAYHGYQKVKPYDKTKPLYMNFELASVTSNGQQFPVYNNLDQLVLEFLGRSHIVQDPNNGLRFGKNVAVNSTINAFFVRN